MASIKTYQDLQEVGQLESHRIQFVKDAITAHKGSELYRNAVIANEYDKQRNVTIVSFQKLLYKVSGEAVPDNYSANYKLCSNFFHRLTTQLVQYELGNGVSWGKPTRKVSREIEGAYQDVEWNDKAEMYVPQWYIAGTDKKVGADFDQRLQELVTESMIGSVAFGFWNFDHLEVFSVREFVPLYDEENGALMAGIRFWQVDANKPLRATLYELDGITDYIWRDSESGTVLKPKYTYKEKAKGTIAEGTHIYDGENYETFPIIPCWNNRQRTSAIVGLRENIDAYDLIRSGFCNDVDEASMLYWCVRGDGMDEIDLARFVDQMRRVKAGLLDEEGAQAEAHTLDVPYASREAILERLRSDMYDDFMAVDTKSIASGATTATQIRASYEPMNSRADELEYCVLDFIQKMLIVAGIDDKATFTRSIIVNRQEEVQILMQSAMYLPEEYITQKVLTVLGDGDAYDEIQKLKDGEDMDRLTITTDDEEEEAQQEEIQLDS